MPTAIEEPNDVIVGTADDAPTRGRAWWVRAVVLVLAVAFLVGAVGYFIGTRTSGPPSNAADIGFLQDMSDHHDQAITMALLTYNKTQDPIIRNFAQDVLIFQRYELGQMAAYL